MTTDDHARTNPLGRYSPTGTAVADDLRHIRLLGVPVRLWTTGAEHHDALMRELTLLALDDHGPELPKRLVELTHNLREAYGGSEGRDERHRVDALAAGLDTIDLDYEVPYAARDAVTRLGALMEAADEFCRNDSLLLTLAPSAGEIAFRRWYVDEFVRQLDGGEPRRWDGPLE